MTHVEAAMEIIKRSALPRPDEKILMVWQCKTLQNWKGIFSLQGSDKRIPVMFEITYNGDKNEYYADRYIKVANEVYEMWDLEKC